MIECDNKNECKEGCMQCMFCGAPSGMVNEDCEGCCGNDGCVLYGRLNREIKAKVTLDDVKSMEELPEIDITKAGDILLSLSIDGKKVIEECGIGNCEAIDILKLIGYGNIGWEKYNVSQKVDVRRVGTSNSEGTIYVTLPKGFCNKGDFVKIETIDDKELRLTICK